VTAVLGSRVTLYCVTDSKSPNTWTINNNPVDSTLMYGGGNEVLVIEDVDGTMEGVYSCQSGRGSISTAHVTIIGQLICTLFPSTYK